MRKKTLTPSAGATMDGRRHELDSAQATASTVESVLRAGHSLEVIDHYAEVVAAVGSNDLAEAMATCSEHHVIVAVGPSEDIRSALESRDYPTEVLDWKSKFLERVETYFPSRLERERKRL